jgi:hypothetical protein
LPSRGFNAKAQKRRWPSQKSKVKGKSVRTVRHNSLKPLLRLGGPCVFALERAEALNDVRATDIGRLRIGGFAALFAAKLSFADLVF